MLRNRNANPTTADATDAPPSLPALITAARAEAEAALLADPTSKRLTEQLHVAQRAVAQAQAVIADLRRRDSESRDKAARAANVENAAERLLAGETVVETKRPTEAEYSAARHNLTVAEAAVQLAEVRLKGLRVAAERAAVAKLFVPAAREAEKRAALTLARLMTENDRLLEAISALEDAGYGQAITRRIWNTLPLTGFSRERFSTAAGLLREAVEMGVAAPDEIAAALDYFGGERLLDYRLGPEHVPPAVAAPRPRRAGAGPMGPVAFG